MPWWSCSDRRGSQRSAPLLGPELHLVDLDPDLLDAQHDALAQVGRWDVAAATSRDEGLHGLLEAVFP